MAGYIESNLVKDEQIIERAQVSWWSQTAKIFLAIICLLLTFSLPIFIVLGALLIAWAIIEVKSTELALTNKRVIAKFGFIRRGIVDVRLGKIESVAFDQSILGRIFNFGDVLVSGAGNSTPIPNISNPNSFKNRVNNYLADIEENKA